MSDKSVTEQPVSATGPESTRSVALDTIPEPAAPGATRADGENSGESATARSVVEPSLSGAREDAGTAVSDPPESTRPSARARSGVRASSRWAAVRGADRRVLAAFLVAALSLLVAAAAVIAWRTDDSDAELTALRERLDTEAAAEQVAAGYALGVSAVRAGDLEGWRAALREGVTEQLATKLSAAVDVVGPWLEQMDYSATAELLAADVLRRDGDLYVVQVFVDMNSRSRQTPEGVVATAAYTVTLNRAADWTITDVGGVTPDIPVPAGQPQAPR